MGWLRQWIDKFYNGPFKKLLKDNYTEMCSTRNEGKSVVTERYTRTLKK